MTVHSCFVEDGQGTEISILQPDGFPLSPFSCFQSGGESRGPRCAKDKFLLDNLEYQTDLMAQKARPNACPPPPRPLSSLHLSPPFPLMQVLQVFRKPTPSSLPTASLSTSRYGREFVLSYTVSVVPLCPLAVFCSPGREGRKLPGKQPQNEEVAGCRGSNQTLLPLGPSPSSLGPRVWVVG